MKLFVLKREKTGDVSSWDYTGRHAWQLSTLIPQAKRASAQFSFFKSHLSLFTYLPVPIVTFLRLGVLVNARLEIAYSGLLL